MRKGTEAFSLIDSNEPVCLRMWAFSLIFPHLFFPIFLFSFFFFLALLELFSAVCEKGSRNVLREAVTQLVKHKSPGNSCFYPPSFSLQHPYIFISLTTFIT